MPENPISQHVSSRLNDVRQTLAQKAWYGLDIKTGAFDWQKSLVNLAETFSLRKAQLEKAIVTAFTPACLSKVQITEGGVKTEKSLLEALKDQQIDPYIWTVGDLDWQRTKFEKSGAQNHILKGHYYFSSQDKTSSLIKLIDSLEKNKQYTKGFVVIVVDDKTDNLNKAMALQKQYSEREIKLGNFHMKLNDPNANPTVFYHWLLEEIKNSKGKEVVVVLDFDGVVADTDSVLFGPASENIFKLLTGD